MDEQFITLLIKGAIKDPILWILSFSIGSGILIKNLKKIYLYLFLGGIIWGFIRVYVYKALGEQFNTSEISQLLFISILLMIIIGILFYLIFYLFKTKD